MYNRYDAKLSGNACQEDILATMWVLSKPDDHLQQSRVNWQWNDVKREINYHGCHN